MYNDNCKEMLIEADEDDSPPRTVTSDPKADKNSSLISRVEIASRESEARNMMLITVNIILTLILVYSIMYVCLK